MRRFSAYLNGWQIAGFAAIAIAWSSSSFLLADETSPPQKPRSFQSDPALNAGEEETVAADAAREAEAEEGLTEEVKDKVKKVREAAADRKKNKKKQNRPKYGKYSVDPRLDKAFAKAMQVRDANVGKLLAIKGVNGVGVGLGKDGQPAVHVTHNGGENPVIPANLDGVPVVVRNVGMITPHWKAAPPGSGKRPGSKGASKPSTGSRRPTATNPKGPRIALDRNATVQSDPTAFFSRPVPIGVSSAPIVADCYSGTLGCKVLRENGDGTFTSYALSNNHVFADENKGVRNSTVIVQPSPGDNSLDFCSTNTAFQIATLSDFVPLKFGAGEVNVVDAAIARVLSGAVRTGTPSDDGYGSPGTEPVAPIVGLPVMKYGRSTGLTFGSIIAINVTVTVAYSTGNALFNGQVAYESSGFDLFSIPGDSGSLVVTFPDAEPVALNFAGGGATAYGNPIQKVIEVWNLHFPEPDPDDGGGILEVLGKRGRPASTIVFNFDDFFFSTKNKK